jgi:hypothetical protein
MKSKRVSSAGYSRTLKTQRDEYPSAVAKAECRPCRNPISLYIPFSSVFVDRTSLENALRIETVAPGMETRYSSLTYPIREHELGPSPRARARKRIKSGFHMANSDLTRPYYD